MDKVKIVEEERTTPYQRIEAGPCILCGQFFERNQDSFFIDAGIVTLDFGYGSGLDDDTYVGIICDNCTVTLHKRGRIEKIRGMV